MDVLLIQDGGCAPGYNTVTGFLTQNLELVGLQVYCAKEGFRSVLADSHHDYQRLIFDDQTYNKLKGQKNALNAHSLLYSPGAAFRSERFNELKEDSVIQKVANNIIRHKIKIVITMGGNGTFHATKDLAQKLPGNVQVAFVPVTIDSDICETECIGQHTGVAQGAEKIQSYLADAKTHKRIYAIEMMGARGGYHALFSCLGSGAHMAFLPHTEPDYNQTAIQLNLREFAVIVVAEGFGKNDPNRKDQNAAEYFANQLKLSGIPLNKKIIAEPFSRDIRGAQPNHMDIALAQRMAYGLVERLKGKVSHFMCAINGLEETIIPFCDIHTDNSVPEELAQLANRIRD